MTAEQIKIDSRYLAGQIRAELDSPAERFEHDAELVLKFHGIYQQDDRDTRRSRRTSDLPPDHSCMVRASVPGGRIEPDQWRALDRLADLAGGTMRLTTRQGVQYHVVPKGDLEELVGGINLTLLTTLGACGDVVRNVMACPLPDERRRRVVQPVIDELIARFRPQTPTYWDLWINGERAASAEPLRRLSHIDDVEPLYGEAYLPRKFKIGIAWPGDNCVDIYTHDVGIVPTLADGTTGALTGFVVLAGGGMGMNHQRDDTYPLLARAVGRVASRDLADLVDVVEAIVATQRDHGNREDRSRARLKYLVEERGIDWLRQQVECRTGQTLEADVELPAWTVHAHQGWHDHIDADGRAGDRRALGLPIPSGTVAGDRRVALRAVVESGYVDGLRVTPRQDLLLCGVPASHVGDLEELLRWHGVPLHVDQSPIRNLSIACPALPTCGKALGEAERVLPEVVDTIEKLLADTGNAGLAIRVNMTGCPNGCARPYSAEIGLVGRTKTTYDLYVGGSAAGDRLAFSLREGVLLGHLDSVLRPLLDHFGRTAASGVSFGDWCAELGVDRLASLLPPSLAGRRR